ncbi:hypothetical protein POM88_029151 [Heracleum sosnowskyi]|uniref:Uncharacterized protein n=1 Tax=Heracleum sosnowskyi TaxID=360622 RepID=A0AAD8HV82_9APIA|nr:hypothetical protein POM88_029151 [Heracleum sosnowskyi]
MTNVFSNFVTISFIFFPSLPFQDESSDTNVGNDEEIDILEKERNNYFCDESTINREELVVPVVDSSLTLNLEEVNKMNDSLEEIEVMKINKESMTTDCNQVGDSYNDWQVPLRIDGNDQELVKAAHTDDQLGIMT